MYGVGILISVITPSHSPKWVANAWSSLLRQDFVQWEWIIVANHGLSTDHCRRVVAGDPRVVILQGPETGAPNVGALKRMASLAARGEYIVEFDHDDELSADCLASLYARFKATGAAFVYSRVTAVREDGSCFTLSPLAGWKHGTLPYRGSRMMKTVCPENPPPLPQNVARIQFAPNHVRAWTSKIYRDVRGHDATLPVCDDLDLMCRMFIKCRGSFVEEDKCLYMYRIHEGNTYRAMASKIAELNYYIQDKYLVEMAHAYWARTHRCILFCDDKPPGPDWESVLLPEHNPVAWPDSCGNGEVGIFWVKNVGEYIRDKDKFMTLLYRKLVHGGLVVIEDLECAWNIDGLMSLRIPDKAGPFPIMEMLPMAEPRFRYQILRMGRAYRTAWHREQGLANVRIHLSAIKDGPRLHGFEFREWCL